MVWFSTKITSIQIKTPKCLVIIQQYLLYILYILFSYKVRSHPGFFHKCDPGLYWNSVFGDSFFPKSGSEWKELRFVLNFITSKDNTVVSQSAEERYYYMF